MTHPRGVLAAASSWPALDRLMVIRQGLHHPAAADLATRAAFRRCPASSDVTHNTWFGGIYQDPANFFATIAVEPEPYLRMYPEFDLPPEQMKAWLADRQGAMVGTRPGDALRLEDRRPRPDPGARSTGGRTARAWEFNVDAIYDAEQGVDKTQFFFRYDYLDETAQERRRQLVGWYVVKIDDPRRRSDGGDVRRDVRQLVGRDQDDDREGVRRGLRQADRRHRRDHGRRFSSPCCSRSCSSPATRWRRRCANGPASSRC